MSEYRLRVDHSTDVWREPNLQPLADAPSRIVLTMDESVSRSVTTYVSTSTTVVPTELLERALSPYITNSSLLSEFEP